MKAMSRAVKLPASELLGENVCELAAHMHAAMAQLTRMAAAFDDTQAWSGYGICSCAHWLSINAGFDVYTAAELLRVGHGLMDLPLIATAFEGGELSLDKVRALCNVATSADEELWVELARQASGSQLARICREYRRAAEASAGDRAQAQLARRGLWARWEDDGMLRLQAVLPADDGAVVLAALEAVGNARCAHASGHDSNAHTDSTQTTKRIVDTANGGVVDTADRVQTVGARSLPMVGDPAYDTHAARRVDALVSICHQALATDSCNQGGTSAPHMVVHVDLGVLTGSQPEGRCHLEDGPALSVAAARRVGCDAEVVAIIERDGLPIDVGRARRIVPTALRRAVQSRDRTCVFPGCGVPARFTHAHHIEHWLKGGSTDRDNLASLCGFHHRRLHDGVYTIRSQADSCLRFETADGRSITVRRLRADASRRRPRKRDASRAEGEREPRGLHRWPGGSAAITPKTPRAGDGGGAYDLSYVIGTMMDGCERAQLRAQCRGATDHPDG